MSKTILRNGNRSFSIFSDFESNRLIEILAQIFGGKPISESEYEVDEIIYEMFSKEYSWILTIDYVHCFSVTIGNVVYLFDDFSSEARAIWIITTLYKDFPFYSDSFEFKEDERNVLDSILMCAQLLGVYPKVFKL